MAAHGGFTTSASDGVLRLALSGPWTIASAPELDAGLAALGTQGVAHAVLDMADVETLDSAGAWLVQRTAARLERAGAHVEVHNVPDAVAGLLARVADANQPVELRAPSKGALYNLVEHAGWATVTFFREARALVGFFGMTVVVILRTLARPGRLRVTATVNHMEQVGLNALPIVGLLSFLIGVVIAYQGADQLRRFGAEIFTVNLIGVSVLRELGILIAAIIIAGRSGSAFTAQIGTMKVNQEVDALQALGLDPVEILVLPRLFALVITLPLTALFANVAGLTGGALMSMFALDISPGAFLRQLHDAVTLTTLMVGLVKAPVFAFVIALVGCYCGLKVQGSAESVGRLTTQSVVESIFLVMVVDAAFSVLFSYLGL